MTAFRAVRGSLSFEQHKVLRNWSRGSSNRVAPVRTSNEDDVQSSLAVRGDAVIHGPNMVAQSVGSEWRTQRPVVLFHPTTKGAPE